MTEPTCPVIIVGAPRSGTSLIQKIVREHEGFRSVAKESGFIWQPYVHPEQNNWQFEGWQGGALDQQKLLQIRAEFARYALSASAWRRAAAFNLMRYQRWPMLAPVLRAGYHVLAFGSSPFRRRPNDASPIERLVDKSVHSPMFLSLVDQVFPNALYVHIVRDGWKTIPSMIDGWLNPNRFFTYDIPGGHNIPDYPHRLWNFALTAGWRDLRHECLSEVVCSQWCSLQEMAIQHFANLAKDRVVRLRLEDLTTSPRQTLEDLCQFLDLPWSPYFDNLSKGLPLVNARPRKAIRSSLTAVEKRMSRLSQESCHRLLEINRLIGYSD